MADEPALMFRRRLGGLFPANAAATDALNALQADATVRARLTSPRGNVRRNGLYWAVLGMAAPMLSERIEGEGLTVKMLHRILKDRAGLFTVVKLPSGQVWKDYDSIAFDKMPEHDRAEFVTFALDTLGKWLGIDATTLREEGQRLAA